MAQTYSVIVVTQIDFEYDSTQMKHKHAIRKALRNVLRPLLGRDGKSDVKVVGVKAMDPDCPGIFVKWGDMV